MNIYSVQLDADGKNSGWVVPGSSPSAAIGKAMRLSKIKAVGELEVSCSLLYRNMTWVQWENSPERVQYFKERE